MSVAWNDDVDLTVEAAYGYGIYETPTWTDISTYVRAINTTRGRSRILDQVQAGQGTLTLDNRDSRFDPADTTGAYYPNVKVLTPIRVQAVYSSTTYNLFRGYVQAWPVSNTANLESVAVVPIVDAFHPLAMFEKTMNKAKAFSGTRIGSVLTTAGFPAGWRDLDTGTHKVAAINEFTSALTEIQRAELVEMGLFWIAPNGDATYRDGSHRIQETTISATFSDDGSNIAWDTDGGLTPSYDAEQLWNSPVITRAGGETQERSDATSITDYGERHLNLSDTLHVSDGEANSMASALLDEFKDPRERIESLIITAERGDGSEYWPAVLGLDLWDKVNVERTPPGSSTTDLDFWVEGVSHDITKTGGNRSWKTTFSLSPDLAHSDWWVLGTSELGTDTRLGY